MNLESVKRSQLHQTIATTSCFIFPMCAQDVLSVAVLTKLMIPHWVGCCWPPRPTSGRASFACKAHRNVVEDPGCCRISHKDCATAFRFQETHPNGAKRCNLK